MIKKYRPMMKKDDSLKHLKLAIASLDIGPSSPEFLNISSHVSDIGVGNISTDSLIVDIAVNIDLLTNICIQIANKV